jgi:hypothetical protein
MGLTVVPRVEIRSGRVLPLFRWDMFCRLTISSFVKPPTYLLVRVCQPYYTPYYLTKR